MNNDMQIYKLDSEEYFEYTYTDYNYIAIGKSSIFFVADTHYETCDVKEVKAVLDLNDMVLVNETIIPDELLEQWRDNSDGLLKRKDDIEDVVDAIADFKDRVEKLKTLNL